MGWFRSVPNPILLAAALMLCLGGMARAEDLPKPPCMASPPEPAYAAAGHTPNIRVWNRRTQTAPWVPPACTGWSAKGAGVLVAVAGSFSDGSSDDLLKRFGAISSLEGLRYWSVTEVRLANSDHPRDCPRRTRPRPSPQGLHPCGDEARADLYFAQSDNRTSGDIVYRMQVKQADASRLVIDIENVTAVRQIPRSAIRAWRFAIGALSGANGTRKVELLRLGLGRRDAVIAALGSRGLLHQPRAAHCIATSAAVPIARSRPRPRPLLRHANLLVKHREKCRGRNRDRASPGAAARPCP